MMPLLVSGALRTGVAIEAVPTLDAGSQAMSLCVPWPNWSSVQALRPVAAAGLIVMPGGRTTEVSLTWELASLVGSPSHGTCTPTVVPTGVSRLVVSGVTETPGANGTWSQPVAPIGLFRSSFVTSLFWSLAPLVETTVSVVVCGPAQVVG